VIHRATPLLLLLALLLASPLFADATTNSTTPNEPQVQSSTNPAQGGSAMKSVIIGMLIAISVLSLTFIIERGLALRKNKVIPPDLSEAQRILQQTNDIDTLRTYCQHYPSPYANLLTCAIDHRHLPRQENADTLQTRARHEVSKLERGLVVLEIVTGIAPLLGLVGTIFGLITLFQSMGVPGADTSHFSEGISIALYATLLGLAVAIPSLTAWSFYTKRIETLAVEMETGCDEFLRSHYHRQD